MNQFPSSHSFRNWLLSLFCLAALTISMFAGLPFLSVKAETKKPQAETISVQAEKRGAPFFNFKNGRDLQTAFVGARAAKVNHPLTMAADDFDGDGIGDLVVGYAGENGGTLSIYRGDINAFAPQTEEKWQAIASQNYPDPFLPDTKTFAVPFAPDFVQTGDFNRDGFKDVLVAASGGNQLFLLAGGKNGFEQTAMIDLPGAVTALAAGDVNFCDGIADAIVAVNGAGIFVYDDTSEGIGGAPKVYAAQNEITSFAVGKLDDDNFGDIAAISGSELLVIHGSKDALKRNISRTNFGFDIAGAAIGDFITDRDERKEIALLSTDGSVQIAARGTLDTRPFTREEGYARLFRSMAQNKQPMAPFVKKYFGGKLPQMLKEPARRQEENANDWTITETVSGATATTSRAASGGNSFLVAGRLAAENAADDLLIVDSASSEVKILTKPDEMKSGSALDSATEISGERALVTLDVADGAPIAALPLRLNVDTESDILILKDGASPLSFVPSAPQATFTVNSNLDAVDATPGNGVCATSTNVCTLRAAIMESNANGLALDQININSGIGTITISLGPADEGGTDAQAQSGDLDILTNLTIVGAAGGSTVQAGATPFQGYDRVFDFDFGDSGLQAGNALSLTMSNLNVNNGRAREMPVATAENEYALGGGLRWTGFRLTAGNEGTLSLTNCNFTNNAADHDGGAVWAQSGGVSISGGVFNANRTNANRGGAIFYSPAAIDDTGGFSLTGATVSNNSTNNGTVFGVAGTPDGGGISVTGVGGHAATLSNVTVSGNTATRNGGGMEQSSTVFTTLNTNAFNNNTAVNGGGVFNDQDPSAAAPGTSTYTGVSFSGNTASATGGGIYHYRGTVTFNGTSNIGTSGAGNTASNGGGLGHAYQGAAAGTNISTINITSSIVQNNTATTSGGGIYSDGTNTNNTTSAVVLNNAQILNNKANLNGGGIANVNGETLTATAAGSTLFRTNRADNDNNATGDGGAIYNSGLATLSNIAIIGGAGTGNTARNGGGIANAGGTFSMTGGVISTNGTASNPTTTNGGGLFVSGGTVTLDGTSLTDNIATNGNGARLTGGTTNLNNTISINNNLDIAGGTLNFNTGTKTIGGNFNFSSGTVNAGSSTVNLAGNFTYTGGTFTPATSTFNFNGTAAQSISNSSSITFNNLTDSNTTNPLTANNSFNVSGTLNINGANAIFTPVAAAVIGGTGTLTGTGTAQVTKASGTNDFLTQYTITNKTLTNLTVEYVGAAAQGISATTYGNLRFNNASGGSLSGSVTVNGAFTRQAGTINISTNTLTLNGTVSGAGGSFSSAATGTVNYNQSSNGQVVLSGNYGNLTFSSFNKDLTNASIGIAGTFTPGAGTATTTGSTINFNGAATQTVPVFNYNNLTISNAAGVTLAGSTTVSGALSLQAGFLNAGANILTLPVGASATRGGSCNLTNCFVASNTSGGVLKQFGAAASSFIFPVGTTGGTDNGYSPVALTNAVSLAGTSGLTVSAIDQKSPVVTTQAITRYWQLTESGNLQTDLAFTYLAADASGVSDLTKLRVFRSNTNVCTTDCVDENTFTGSVAGITDFSPWTIAVPAAPTASTVSIGGRLVTANGRAVSRAIVNLTDANGQIRTAMSNTFGYFRFVDVEVGDYVINVKHKTYRFNTNLVNATSDVNDLVFVAQQGGEGAR